MINGGLVRWENHRTIAGGCAIAMVDFLEGISLEERKLNDV
jgi:hypothetical protein